MAIAIDKENKEHNSQEAKGKIVLIEPQKIAKNPYQPRKIFSKEEVEELALSIQEVGLIHPPVVRQLDNGTFELVSGERRLRACMELNYPKIEVVVLEATDNWSSQAALIENIQRVDLNPIEVSKALLELMQMGGLTQEEVAKKVGKKRSTIANYLRLLSLPQMIQESIQKKEITMGHAKALLSIEEIDIQLQVFEMAKEMSVRELEIKVQNLLFPKRKKQMTFEDLHTKSLQEKLQEILQLKVEIKNEKKGGKLVVHYQNLDELDHVLELLGHKDLF